MSHVLRKINYKYAPVYVDDILKHSSNFDEHLVHLQNVFDRLNDAKLKLQSKNVNSQLVELITWEYTFLNYGIETNPSKNGSC